MSEPEYQTGETEQSEESGRRSRAWQTLGIGVLIIIIVLIFLMLWDPNDSERNVTDGGRRPGIVGAVEDLPASDDYIGLWLKPGKDIADVLSRHGLSEDDVLFSQDQDGYFVVAVTDEDAQAIVKAMKGDAALYDAGMVYEQEAPETP